MSVDTRRADRLLTVPEAAAQLNTSQRFVRRLIDERRIKFVRIGRHIRIPQSVLLAFIDAGVVDPLLVRRGRVA